MPAEVAENFKAEYIVPLVGYLVSEECEETGSLLEGKKNLKKKFLRWKKLINKINRIKKLKKNFKMKKINKLDINRIKKLKKL